MLATSTTSSTQSVVQEPLKQAPDLGDLPKISTDTTCVYCSGKDGAGRKVTIGFRYTNCGDVIDFDCLNTEGFNRACPKHPDSGKFELVSYETDKPINRLRIMSYPKDYPINPDSDEKRRTWTINFIAREIAMKSGETSSSDCVTSYSSKSVPGYAYPLPAAQTYTSGYMIRSYKKFFLPIKTVSQEIDSSGKVIDVSKVTLSEFGGAGPASKKLNDEYLSDPNAYSSFEWFVPTPAQSTVSKPAQSTASRRPSQNAGNCNVS